VAGQRLVVLARQHQPWRPQLMSLRQQQRRQEQQRRRRRQQQHKNQN
jgi:hypothetical protein